MSGPSEPRFPESIVERQIREAQECGLFDDLPGAGRPLPGLDEPDDENWWIRRKLREEGISADLLLPESILLRKELDRLPATLDGLATEREVRDAVGALNLRVAEYLRHPSPPRVRVTPVRVEEAVARWRAALPAPPTPPAPPPPPVPRTTDEPAARRRRWWQRRG